MVSEDGAPPMESLPSPKKVHSEVDRNTKRAETPRIRETLVQAAQKSPPRNGIPPKRLMTAAKRTSTSTPSSATKPTASSTSRHDPVNGLSKPPTRPTPTSSARRPATNVTAASAPRVGHKPRSPFSLVDENKKSDISSSEENLKPSAALAARRQSTSSTAATRSPTRPAASSAASSASRRSTVASNTNADSKPASDRLGSGTSAKQPLRTATNSSRPTSTSTTSTPRSTRPTLMSTRNGTGSDLAQKRLSTIPASPSLSQPGKPASDPRTPPAPTAKKAVRPGLATRKSTMSVTIEQRLQEMDLVHRMLVAAMADDGVEDDQVKEQYGKTADDTLASLKARLGEARRREGKQELAETKDHEDGNTDKEVSNESQVQSAADHSRSQSALSTTTQKVSSLEAELAALKEQMLQYTEAADRVSKDVEEVTERMSMVQESKIGHLIATHNQELAALRAELSEAESRHKEQLQSSLRDVEEAKRIAEAEGSKKAAKALESQMQEHTHNMKLLKENLADEKRREVDVTSKIEQMDAEVSSLKHLLSEEQQKSKRLAQDFQMQQEDGAKELGEALNTKEKEISNLEREMQDLQNTHSREMEELESATSAKESLLEAKIDSLLSKTRDLESVSTLASTSHDEVLQSKEREIMHQSQVIEDLQNKLQELHEVKEREIEEVKQSLLSEHEQFGSKVHREHETVLSALRDTTRKKAEETALLHEQDKKRLEEERKLGLDKLDRELADMSALKANLESSIEAMTTAKSKESKQYQDQLEETEKALEEMRLAQRKANEASDEVRAEIGSLESQRDQAQAEKLYAQEALKVASREVTSLKKTLETLENASSDSDKQYASAIQKMKDEADATSKMLEDQVKEHNSASAAHTQELKHIRASHSKEIKGLEKKNREALQTMRKTHDDLLAKFEKVEKEHPSTINVLKSEHADALDKQTKNIESLKTAYTKELTKLQSQIQGSDDLRRQHEKHLGSLRTKLEDSRAAQKMQETIVVDLKTQLEKQSEVLADVERQLREARALRSEEGSEKAREANTQVEKFGQLLADAQAKIAQDKEAIERLTKAVEEASEDSLNVVEAERLREELSELTEQHAAQISKLQEAASLGNDQREKERNHETEIRDGLMDELEKVKANLTANEEEAKKQQKVFDAQKQTAEELEEKLSTARMSEERIRIELQEALAEFEAFKAEAESAKASLEEPDEAVTDATNQMLETLQAAADAERELNATLKQRVHHAETAAEKHATRVRELESALKVTTAELNEMRTERRGVSEYTGSPAPVLRSSLWPVPDSSDSGDSRTAIVGEEQGSSIVGRMAGMQEQIRQLEGVNEDMLEDAERLVRLISRVAEPTRAAKPEPETSADEEDEEEL